MLQAIVFDFDGVLVESEPLHYRAFSRVLRPLGADFDYDQYRRKYMGFDDREGLRTISADYGIALDARQLARLVARKAQALDQVLTEGVEPCPGSLELVRAAADHMPLALCSGALRRDIDAMCRALPENGILELFSAMVTADDVQRSKPDPQSYALAVERLGLHPSHCLAIEDTPAGLASARAAGLRTLGLISSDASGGAEDELRRLADHTVHTLADVTVCEMRQWFVGENTSGR